MKDIAFLRIKYSPTAIEQRGYESTLKKYKFPSESFFFEFEEERVGGVNEKGGVDKEGYSLILESEV